MKHCLVSGCKPPYQFANSTDQEYFNLYGTLPAERIQALIDQSEVLEACSDAKSALQDALGAYPNEDCLADVLKYVRSLEPYLNKAGKEALKRAIRDIEVEQSALCNRGEYGAEVINNFIKSVSI